MQQTAREAVEAAVTEAQAIDQRALRGGHADNSTRQQRRHDRHRLDALHRRIFTLLTPRIHHLTGRYGLTDMEDDARQACAIAIHRAIGSYDPVKASFSTHVTWAMRGELQSLRHRVRLDQRDSAKAAGIATVSLEGLSAMEGENVFEIVDDHALAQVERGASDTMAFGWITNLLNDADQQSPRRSQYDASDRKTAISYWIDGGSGSPRQREAARQVSRRLARRCRNALQAPAQNL